MGWAIGADLVLVVHLAFVAFIVIGGFAVRRWPRSAWLHLAALGYGAAIQAIGFTCPLTPLEKHLRAAAGEAVYEGGFIGHYIIPVLYPGELTRSDKAVLVAAIAAVNLVAYSWAIRPWLLGRRPPTAPA